MRVRRGGSAAPCFWLGYLLCILRCTDRGPIFEAMGCGSEKGFGTRQCWGCSSIQAGRQDCRGMRTIHRSTAYYHRLRTRKRKGTNRRRMDRWTRRHLSPANRISRKVVSSFLGGQMARRQSFARARVRRVSQQSRGRVFLESQSARTLELGSASTLGTECPAMERRISS